VTHWSPSTPTKVKAILQFRTTDSKCSDVALLKSLLLMCIQDKDKRDYGKFCALTETFVDVFIKENTEKEKKRN
jgi:hypothetical protein